MTKVIQAHQESVGGAKGSKEEERGEGRKEGETQNISTGQIVLISCYCFLIFYINVYDLHG